MSETYMRVVGRKLARNPDGEREWIEREQLVTYQALRHSTIDLEQYAKDIITRQINQVIAEPGWTVIAGKRIDPEWTITHDYTPDDDGKGTA